MLNLNEVRIIGRVTRDPELRVSNNGTQIAKFSVATNFSWKEQNGGDKHEETEFHNCVAFGKKAEVITQYVIKGQEVMVTGRLKTSEWEKQDGTKGRRTEIMVNDCQFGSKPKSSSDSTVQQAVQKGVDNALDDDIPTEDIPF